MVVGEGSIDLGAETGQLTLVPKPHTASPLSTAATVLVTGPLAAPDVNIDKTSLVISAMSAIAKKVDRVTQSRRAWRWLRGKKAEPTLCEKFLEFGS